MSARPWYKRFPSDFIAGTISLTLEEAGAYSYIIDLIHDRGGPIPDDPQWIARVCGCSTRKWNTIRKNLIQAGKIFEKGGQISSFRAEKDAINSVKNEVKSSENNLKNDDLNAEKTTKGIEINTLTKIKPNFPSRAHTTTRSQKLEKERTLSGSKEKTPKRKSKIADDWKPSDEDVAFAIEKGMTLLIIEVEAGQFRDHHLKVGSLFLDWHAAWRTWVRNWAKWRAERKSGANNNSGDGMAELIRREGA